MAALTPRKRNVLVGSVVLVAMVGLAWMVLKFSGREASSVFNKGTDIQLIADRADGVSEGSPLFYLGVNVGRVTGVRRLADNTGVTIDATIDPNQPPLPNDVVGVIRTQSALGTAAAISLEPRHRRPATRPASGPAGVAATGPSTEPSGPAGPLLAPGTLLRASFQGGGVVPPEFSEVAAEIREQQLVKHLDEAVVSVRTQVDQVGEILKQVNGFVGDEKVRNDLRTSLANIRQTSENLQKASGRLDEMSTEAKDTLASVHTNVDKTGQRIDDISRQVGDRLTQVGEMVGKFQSVAAKVDKGEGSAGQLVNDPRLYESMVDTSKELNETVKALKRLVEQWEKEGLSVKTK